MTKCAQGNVMFKFDLPEADREALKLISWNYGMSAAELVRMTIKMLLDELAPKST